MATQKSDYYLLNMEGDALREELAKLDNDNIMRLAVRMADQSPVDAFKIQSHLPPEAQARFKKVIRTIYKSRKNRKVKEPTQKQIARLYFERKSDFSMIKGATLAVIAYGLLTLAVGYPP